MKEVEGEEEEEEMAEQVKVMTEEQMEVLRKQICVYSTICEQLVEMHKALTAHQDLGTLYCDPLKITARQRWTPTPLQLQILERLFQKANATPTKHNIKHITLQLAHHGQISETNVYNWFQNRRARSKRNQLHSPKHKSQPIHPSQTAKDLYIHTPHDIGFEQFMTNMDCYSPYFQGQIYEMPD